MEAIRGCALWKVVRNQAHKNGKPESRTPASPLTVDSSRDQRQPVGGETQGRAGLDDPAGGASTDATGIQHEGIGA